MPTLKKLSELHLTEKMTDKFVAFLDVLGFSELVNANNLQRLETYFIRIGEVLDELRESKEKIESFIISDSIILIAPSGLTSFRELVQAVRRIQSALLWKNILTRGAISHGPVYYNDKKNIIVGRGYIRAYLLEKEAIFPRIIIDPAIISLMGKDKAEFLKSVNKSETYNFEQRLIHVRSEISNKPEDGIFVEYANKIIGKSDIKRVIHTIYSIIKDNLYGEQKHFSKYIWLRDYFIECMRITRENLNAEDNSETRSYIKVLDKQIVNFKRL